MTTKNDELKALEKIKAIVDGLGSDSYLAAAFDGCFDIAEENISNDWTTSPKESLALARQDLEAEKAKNKDLTEQLDIARVCITNREEHIERLNALVLSAPVIEKLVALVSRNIVQAVEAKAVYADCMADRSDKPESPEFQNAVKLYRDTKIKIEELNNLERALQR